MRSLSEFKLSLHATNAILPTPSVVGGKRDGLDQTEPVASTATSGGFQPIQSKNEQSGEGRENFKFPSEKQAYVRAKFYNSIPSPC